MMKQVLVPVANGTEELEAIAIVDILRRAGTNVIVASVDDAQVTCANGTSLVADKLLKECASMPFDLIVLPGGDAGARRFQETPELINMLKAQDQSKKLLGAICASPAVVLEHHGIINGRNATAYPSYADKLKNQAKAKDRVVVDGHLITSAGPGTAVEFALTLVEHVVSGTKAKELSNGILAKS